MNPFQAMANPQQFVSQQLQNKLQDRMNKMAQQNPQAFQRMREMIDGKSEGDMKETCLNLAKQRGVDIGKFASQFGIRL